jgi:hypothetical protein
MCGVANFVQGRWRVEVPEWNRKGRVVVVRRRGLAIANVDAVNGTSKPYFDDAGRVAGDRQRILLRRARIAVAGVAPEPA